MIDVEQKIMSFNSSETKINICIFFKKIWQNVLLLKSTVMKKDWKNKKVLLNY